MQIEKPSIDDYIRQAGTGRHETFTPRYGWLKKGYDATVDNGYVFKAPDAIEILGVGKNMVRSIRFWCLAFKIIELNPDQKGSVIPTQFGEKLLSVEGWDPYLEDIASLWLLHWMLFTPTLEAVNWPFAFNRNQIFSFDSKNLAKILVNAAKKYPNLANLSENTFEKDASCILRMYVDGGRDTEIDCPFTQLEIIRRAEEKNQFYFDNSDKSSIPPLIYAAACFSYIDNYASSTQKTMSMNRLTFGFNSPGVVFKLSETVSGEKLRLASEKMGGISIIEQAGGFQIHLDGNPGELFFQALDIYYKEQQ